MRITYATPRASMPRASGRFAGRRLSRCATGHRRAGAIYSARRGNAVTGCAGAAKSRIYWLYAMPEPSASTAGMPPVSHAPT